jgi:hypothetical protein
MTHSPRKRAALAVSALLAAPLAVVATTAPPATAGDGPLASSIAMSWQKTALKVMSVDTTPAPGPPVMAMYLSFTSLAVYDAAREAQKHGTHAAAAAVATAAHDVLWEYFTSTAARNRIDAELDASLDAVPDGKKEDAGVEIGAAAADRMIASRVGDGRFASVVYSKAPAPGIWQPPPTGMALAWFAFLKPVVDVPTVQLDGPDALGSAAYAADYNEVKRIGATNSAPSDRSAEETTISRFMNGVPNASVVVLYREALLRHLEAEPMGLIPTTRLFARLDAATTEAFIQTWRLKYDLGYWRPFQAIAGAATDGNDATEPLPAGETWLPLIPNPAYSDYTSGHAAATAPFAEIVRHTLGDDTELELRLTGFDNRTYANLTALEHDALMARIWGGLHFRDAMDDGYLLGHTVAHDVMSEIK